MQCGLDLGTRVVRLGESANLGEHRFRASARNRKKMARKWILASLENRKKMAPKQEKQPENGILGYFGAICPFLSHSYFPREAKIHFRAIFFPISGGSPKSIFSQVGRLATLALDSDTYRACIKPLFENSSKGDSACWGTNMEEERQKQMESWCF